MKTFLSKEDMYKKAIENWGEDIQIYVATEEMGELIQGLSKFLRKGKIREEKNIANIIEEIADVEIMLEQLKLIFDPNDTDFVLMKDIKLQRLYKKITEK